MSFTFRDAAAFNGNITGWVTSGVIDMDDMFRDAIAFNQNISGWDTSDVTDMPRMFQGATAFNQDLSGWDVDNVDECDDFSTDSGMATGSPPNPNFPLTANCAAP